MTTSEWHDEPDEKDWASEQHKLPCAIRRSPTGALCGYVAVGADHPAFGKDYDDLDIDVHGGLTYGCDHAPHAKSDGLWWLGFDCAHAGDFAPQMAMFGDAVYRNLAYVENECERLAEQLAKMT